MVKFGEVWRVCCLKLPIGCMGACGLMAACGVKILTTKKNPAAERAAARMTQAVARRVYEEGECRPEQGRLTSQARLLSSCWNTFQQPRWHRIGSISIQTVVRGLLYSLACSAPQRLVIATVARRCSATTALCWHAYSPPALRRGRSEWMGLADLLVDDL